ncbi:IQ calmodulin-binding motif [Seminavis robusta]|uniref:IQ calmodulin-binding motif n=1 Tax=Seminavis robusta TaxID=568900 RepID=A0A9N8E379_9STRA|nr:IQ calmodulin-binding motif [Seminavis robusta]|eukprot:Sro611_g175370.1 IQ calmodulin-binding motif (2218) ;mRNA; r:44096-50827
MMSVQSFQSSRDPAGIDPSGVDIVAGTDPPPDENRESFEADPPILPPHSMAGPPPPTPRRTHHPVTQNGIRAPSPVMAFLVGSPPPPPPTPPPQKQRAPAVAPPSHARRRHLPLSPAGDASATTGFSSLSSPPRRPPSREPRELTESVNPNFVDQRRREALAIYESPNLYMVHDEPGFVPARSTAPEAPKDQTKMDQNQTMEDSSSSRFDSVISMASPRSAATEPHSNQRTAMKRNLPPKRTNHQESSEYQLNEVPPTSSSSSSSVKPSNVAKRVKTEAGTGGTKKRRGRASTGTISNTTNATRPKTPERRGRGKSSERNKRAETPERQKRGFFRNIFRGGKKTSKSSEGNYGNDDDGEELIQKAKPTPKKKPTNNQVSQISSMSPSPGILKSSTDASNVALPRVAFRDDPSFSASHQNQKVSSLEVDTGHETVREAKATSEELHLGFGLGLDTVTSGLTNDVEPERRDIFFAHDEVSTLTAPSAHDHGRRNVDPIEASATVSSGQSSEPMGHYWNGAGTVHSDATPKASASSPTIDPFTAPFFQEPDGESPITSKKAKASLQVDVPPTLDPSGETPREKASATHLNEPSPRGWESPITELKDPLGSTISETNSRRSIPGFGRSESTQQPKIPPSQRSLPHELRREPSAFRDGSPYALDPPLRFPDDDSDDKLPKNVAGIISRLHSKARHAQENKSKVAADPETEPPSTRDKLDSLFSTQSQSADEFTRKILGNQPPPATTSSGGTLSKRSLPSTNKGSPPQAVLEKENPPLATLKKESPPHAVLKKWGPPQAASKTESPPQAALNKANSPRIALISSPQVALKKASHSQIDPSPDIKKKSSDILLPESPDTTGFLDDLFQEKPASSHKRPSIVRPISINITESSNPSSDQSSNVKDTGPSKTNAQTQIIEIHRTQRIASPRSNKLMGGPFVTEANSTTPEAQPSPPSRPPVSPWTEQRLYNGSTVVYKQRDGDEEEKKEQEHGHVYTSLDASPSKAMLATGTAALSTAACMNAKTVAYLHTLNGQPSPRHSWRRPDFSDDEYSPPVKPEIQRKEVSAVKVSISKKRALQAPECNTDEAAFDSFISSGPISPPMSTKSWRHGRVNFIAASAPEPPPKASSLVAKIRNKQPVPAPASKPKPLRSIPVIKSIPVVRGKPQSNKPKNAVKLHTQSKYGALSPRSRKQARENFRRPLYYYRFNRDVRVTGAALTFGLDLQRRKREEDILNGFVIPSRKPKLVKKKKPAPAFRPMVEEDIKDPIQRAGRRLLTKAAVPIQSSARMYLARQEALQRMEAIIILQSYFRRWQCEAFLRAYKFTCTKIQAAFRSWLVQDEIAFKHYHATQIQKVVRGYIAAAYVYDAIYWVSRLQASFRGKLARLRFRRLFELRERSALRLQSWHRGCLARAEATERRLAICSVQTVYRMHLAKVQYHLTIEDIVTTQSVARRYLARKVTDEMRSVKMNSAACKIQATWRGFQGYTDYIFALVDILVLQRTMRKWLAKRRVESLRRTRAAIKIQAQWRRQTALIGMLYDLVHIIIVQSIARRFLANRKIIPRIRLDYSLRMEHQQKLDAAATQIQTAWRGFWGYSHFIIMQYEIIRLQAIIRGRASRILFSLKLGCCIMIQSSVRRFLANKKVFRLRLKQASLGAKVEGLRVKLAVQRIQFWWRVVMECSKEKHAALVIERFFMMVKAEVDKEIVRQQQLHELEEREIQAKLTNRSKEQHRKKQEIKKSAAEDKLLERVWLNTVDSDDIFAQTATPTGTGPTPKQATHAAPTSTRSKSAPRPHHSHQNPVHVPPPREEAPTNGFKSHMHSPITVKHRPSSPSNALVMRHENDRSTRRENDRSRPAMENNRSTSRRERENERSSSRTRERENERSSSRTRREHDHDRDRSTRREQGHDRSSSRRERENDRASSNREKEAATRKEEVTKTSRRIPRSKPPPDVTLTRSDERTEVSAITSPSVFRKSGGGKRSTKNSDRSGKSQRKFDDEDESDGGENGDPIPVSTKSKVRKDPSSAPAKTKKSQSSSAPRKTPKSHFFSEETVATTPGGKANNDNSLRRRHSIATVPSEDSAIISEFSDMPSQIYSRAATTTSRTTATHPETLDSAGGSPRSDFRSDVQTEIDVRQTVMSGLSSNPSVDKLYGKDRYSTVPTMSAVSKGKRLLESVRSNNSNKKSPGSPRHGQIMVKNCNDFPILSKDSRDNVEAEYPTEVEQFGMI